MIQHSERNHDMAKNSKYAFNRAYYEQKSRIRVVEGSAARKLEEDYDFEDELQPVYDSYDYEDLFAEDDAEYVYKNRAETRAEPAPAISVVPEVRIVRRLNLSMGSVLLFAGVVVLLLACAFKMLSVQSDISKIDKKISAASNELKDVNSLNASLMASLDTEIDRNYIYSVAVGRLGMVYPDKNQVVTYTRSDDGYVRQMGMFP